MLLTSVQGPDHGNLTDRCRSWFVGNFTQVLFNFTLAEAVAELQIIHFTKIDQWSINAVSSVRLFVDQPILTKERKKERSLGFESCWKTRISFFSEYVLWHWQNNQLNQWSFHEIHFWVRKTKKVTKDPKQLKELSLSRVEPTSTNPGDRDPYEHLEKFTRLTVIQMHWKKRKFLHKKGLILDTNLTAVWLPWRHVKTLGYIDRSQVTKQNKSKIKTNSSSNKNCW